MDQVGAIKHTSFEDKMDFLSKLGKVHVHGFEGRRWYVTVEFVDKVESYKYEAPAKDSLSSAIDEVMEQIMKDFNED